MIDLEKRKKFIIETLNSNKNNLDICIDKFLNLNPKGSLRILIDDITVLPYSRPRKGKFGKFIACEHLIQNIIPYSFFKLALFFINTFYVCLLNTLETS